MQPIETYFISGLLPSVLGLMVGLALLMVEPEVMPMVQPFNLCLVSCLLSSVCSFMFKWLVKNSSLLNFFLLSFVLNLGLLT